MGYLDRDVVMTALRCMEQTIRHLCSTRYPNKPPTSGTAVGAFSPFTRPVSGEEGPTLAPQETSHPTIPDDLADTAPVPGFDPWAIPGAGGPLVLGMDYTPGEGTLEPDEGDVVAEGHD